MATSLNQLPAVVDQMPMPDVWEMFEYWNEYPPEHLLLRGFVGYEPAEVAEIDSNAAGELAAVFGSAQKPPVRVMDLMKWADEMSAKRGVKRG